jgi:hypothetical protein
VRSTEQFPRPDHPHRLVGALQNLKASQIAENPFDSNAHQTVGATVKFQGAVKHHQAAIHLSIESKSVFVPNIIWQRLSDSTPITSPPEGNFGNTAHHQTPISMIL